MTIALGGFEYRDGFSRLPAVSSAARKRPGSAAPSELGPPPTAPSSRQPPEPSRRSPATRSQNWIYKSDTIGTVTATRNVYRPSQPTDSAAALVCGTWFPISIAWPATTRDTTGTTRDWLGVKIQYDHAWKTGFLWWTGSSRWVEDAVMHLEPSF